MKKYQPINCNFYDYLEHFATLKQQVAIVFIDNNEQETTVNSVIENIYAKNGEEFLVLNNNNTNIRLDRLISVNGLKLDGDSCQF